MIDLNWYKEFFIQNSNLYKSSMLMYITTLMTNNYNVIRRKKGKHKNILWYMSNLLSKYM